MAEIVTIIEVNKFNPYHDSRGRFTSAGSAGGGAMSTAELARSGILDKYNYIGIRTLTDDEKYVVGDTARESYDWDHENDQSTYDTDDPVSLGGSCSIGIKYTPDWDEPEELEAALQDAMNTSSVYSGERKVILGSREQIYGEDPGEWILPDAEVLAVLDPKSGKWLTTPPKKPEKQGKQKSPKSDKKDSKGESPKITNDAVEQYKNKVIDDFISSHPNVAYNKFTAWPNMPSEVKRKVTALRNYASTGDTKWLDGLDLSDVPIGKSSRFAEVECV